MNNADPHKTMRPWPTILAVCLLLLAPSAFGGPVWVNWATGSTQPFTNSSGAVGTVSYHTADFSVGTFSNSSPDVGFPFPNPVDFFYFLGTSDGSIIITFDGVSPDAKSLFTLGNLRPKNRFLVSAFDTMGTPISLTSWTNKGEYRIAEDNNGPNLWDPVTGVMVGAGTIGDSPTENAQNLFFGLTSDTAKIRVDFIAVENPTADNLNFGIAGSAIPEPSSLALVSLALAIIGIKLRLFTKSNC